MVTSRDFIRNRYDGIIRRLGELTSLKQEVADSRAELAEKDDLINNLNERSINMERYS